MTNLKSTESSAKSEGRFGAFLQTCAVSCCLVCLAASSAPCQEPDVARSGGVTIHKGGGIAGVVENPDADSSGYYEIAPSLGGKISVAVSEVKQTTTLRPEQISYRKFAPLEKDDVASQLKIARWASTQKLSAIADAHY